MKIVLIFFICSIVLNIISFLLYKNTRNRYNEPVLTVGITIVFLILTFVPIVNLIMALAFLIVWTINVLAGNYTPFKLDRDKFLDFMSKKIE